VLPGLAERREDVEPYIDYERARFAKRERNRVTLNKEVRRHYLSFAMSSEVHRPGNFRDLTASLTRGMELTGFDLLWVADITCIRMREEFAFPAVVPNAFSRRVIGWALEEHMLSLAVATLAMALKRRRPAPFNLVHHSDRSVQYARADYTGLFESQPHPDEHAAEPPYWPHRSP
jgi:sigma54-dependent transcription regulator